MLQTVLGLIERDGPATAIHRGPDRAPISRARLIEDLHRFPRVADPPGPPAGRATWVAVRDPYLLLLSALGCLWRTSPALLDWRTDGRSCDLLAAACRPGALLVDDPGAPAAAWARDRAVPVVVVDERLDARPHAPRPDPPPPAGAAIHLFTSGTTGPPRCVRLGAGQVEAAVRGVRERLGTGPDDVSLATASLTHTLGLVTTALVALASGGGIAFADHARPADLRWTIAAARPTWCAAGPATHRLLLRLARDRGLRWPSLRFLRSSSAPLDAGLAAELEGRFGAPVVDAYVMTEAPGEISSQGLREDRRPGTVGRPTLCRVVVRSAAVGPAPGGAGELWISGPNVAAEPGAWLRTGDAGSLDESGYLRLVGRTDDVINQGGLKVWPPEVEAAALEHPLVRAAVAFGVPDPGLGEVVALAVEPHDGHVLDRRALRRHLMDRLPRERWPSRIVVCERIPVSARGKVSRRSLPALLGLTGPG